MGCALREIHKIDVTQQASLRVELEQAPARENPQGIVVGVERKRAGFALQPVGLNDPVVRRIDPFEGLVIGQPHAVGGDAWCWRRDLGGGGQKDSHHQHGCAQHGAPAYGRKFNCPSTLGPGHKYPLGESISCFCYLGFWITAQTLMLEPVFLTGYRREGAGMAVATRRARENARRRSVHYVEHIFRAQRRRRGQLRGRSR